jgi:hypothetical protein
LSSTTHDGLGSGHRAAATDVRTNRRQETNLRLVIVP